ncbi:probable RNA-directed DNA polymerase from transposon X-element [Trichonephila clavipes]|nr:probable RNA-directed DNA polymerase from transposon X-element [Trichonephila clavipes]
MRHGGILNSHRVTSPLVRLVEGEERWETPDCPQGGTKNRTTRVICSMLQLTTGLRLALCATNFMELDLTSKNSRLQQHLIIKIPPTEFDEYLEVLRGALGSIAVTPIEKAEVIADSLQKQFEPNNDVENPFLDFPTCIDLEKTSPFEIQGFIKNLKPNKSPGIDLIRNRILKNLSTKFIIFIALLFNMLLENCYFSKSWTMAVVIPILKPNSDDSNPHNYRPITLLSSLSKAYEFVILNRLNQHCLARIIIPEQHGFVTKSSTVTQLLRVTELVHTGFQNHQSTGMLFVDIAKPLTKFGMMA